MKIKVTLQVTPLSVASEYLYDCPENNYDSSRGKYHIPSQPVYVKASWKTGKCSIPKCLLMSQYVYCYNNGALPLPGTCGQTCPWKPSPFPPCTMFPYSLSLLTGNPVQKGALKSPNAECSGILVSVCVKTNTMGTELIL